eukprot:jgi/Chlat1/9149/Chrsp97S08438
MAVVTVSLLSPPALTAPRSVAGRRQQPALRATGTGRRSAVCQASPADQGQAASSRRVLDAFFLGRAVAEAINERLGSALGEVLSEIGKYDAERRRAMQDFENDVKVRAQRELEQSTKAAANARSRSPSTTSSGGVSAASPITPPDLAATVDRLRAEVARTRAEVQRMKRLEGRQ